MKIGRNASLYISSFLAGIFVATFIVKKKNFNYPDSNKQSNFDPSISFIEFFEKDAIKEAHHRYEKYIDLGLNKEDAFKAVVEDNRNI